jgi:hypothetical protein
MIMIPKNIMNLGRRAPISAAAAVAALLTGCQQNASPVIPPNAAPVPEPVFCKIVHSPINSNNQNRAQLQQLSATPAEAPNGRPTILDKPISTLNIDRDENESETEKRLRCLMNLQQDLNALLGSKDNVHLAFTGDTEETEKAAQGALNDLKTSQYGRLGVLYDHPHSYLHDLISSRYSPESLEQIDMKDIPTKEKEKESLAKLLKQYLDTIDERRNKVAPQVRKYITDNGSTIDDVLGLGFSKELAPTSSNRDVINLALYASHSIAIRIGKILCLDNTESCSYEFRLGDRLNFLEKYASADLSNVEKSIQFLQNLTNEEFLLYAKYSSRVYPTPELLSRESMARELVAHGKGLSQMFPLDLENVFTEPYLLGLFKTLSFEDNLASVILALPYKFTDKNKGNQNEFIKNLDIKEYVLLSKILDDDGLSKMRTKEDLLFEINKPENHGKSLAEIFGYPSDFKEFDREVNNKLSPIQRLINELEES